MSGWRGRALRWGVSGRALLLFGIVFNRYQFKVLRAADELA